MRMRDRKYRIRQCIICSKMFMPDHPRSRRCSKCQDLHCAICGKSIAKSVHLSRHKKGNVRCCMDCYRKYPLKRHRCGKQVAAIGERRLGKYGYVYVKTECGWRLEHRIIMESMLGRPLHVKEHVHHIDQDRSNNTPENLAICTGLRDHLERFHSQHLKNPPTHHNGRRRKGDPGYLPIGEANENTSQSNAPDS